MYDCCMNNNEPQLSIDEEFEKEMAAEGYYEPYNGMWRRTSKPLPPGAEEDDEE